MFFGKKTPDSFRWTLVVGALVACPVLGSAASVFSAATAVPFSERADSVPSVDSANNPSVSALPPLSVFNAPQRYPGAWQWVDLGWLYRGSSTPLVAVFNKGLPQLTAPFLGAPEVSAFWLDPSRGFLGSERVSSGWTYPSGETRLEAAEVLRTPVPTVLLEATNGTLSGQQFGFRAGMPLSNRASLAGHFLRTNAKGPYERQSVLNDDFLMQYTRNDSIGSGWWQAAVKRDSWKGWENGGVVDPTDVVGTGWGIRNRALVDTRWASASSNQSQVQALVQRGWSGGTLGYRWERNQRAFRPDALGLDTSWGASHQLEYRAGDRWYSRAEYTRFKPDTVASSPSDWGRWTVTTGYTSRRRWKGLSANGALALDSRWGLLPTAQLVRWQRIHVRSNAEPDTSSVQNLLLREVLLQALSLRVERSAVPWIWQTDWTGAAPWKADFQAFPLAWAGKGAAYDRWTINVFYWSGLSVPTSSGYLGLRSFTPVPSAWVATSSWNASTSNFNRPNRRWNADMRLVGQWSSDALALPVPALSYVGSVSRKWNWTDRGVLLTLSLGAVGNTPYYAAAYDPRWGAAVTQVGWQPEDRQRIARWAMPHVQLQVQWKTASAYVVLNQFTQGWAPWAAMASPFVATADAHLRLGVRWYLFN